MSSPAPFGESMAGTFEEVTDWLARELSNIGRRVRQDDDPEAFLGCDLDVAHRFLTGDLTEAVQSLAADLEHRMGSGEPDVQEQPRIVVRPRREDDQEVTDNDR